MSHTPGPWRTNYRMVTPVNAAQDGSADVCHVYGDEETEIANARLIASAPDLLAACERWLAISGPQDAIEARFAIQEAVKKARGE